MTARPRLFGGTCDLCNQFRPRCGMVRMRVTGATGQAPVYDPRPVVLCYACRFRCRGKYKYAR